MVDNVKYIAAEGPHWLSAAQDELLREEHIFLDGVAYYADAASLLAAQQAGSLRALWDSGVAPGLALCGQQLAWLWRLVKSLLAGVVAADVQPLLARAEAAVAGGAGSLGRALGAGGLLCSACAEPRDGSLLGRLSREEQAAYAQQGQRLLNISSGILRVVWLRTAVILVRCAAGGGASSCCGPRLTPPPSS